MIFYRFSCVCGYETSQSLWIPGFVIDTPFDIQEQLVPDKDSHVPMHPEARRVWEELLYHPLVEQERNRIARQKKQANTETKERTVSPLLRKRSGDNIKDTDFGAMFKAKLQERLAQVADSPMSNSFGHSSEVDEPRLLISVWELGHCHECGTLNSYLQVVNRQTKEVLNASRCRNCGSDVQILDLEHVHCPKCGRHIESKQYAME